MLGGAVVLGATSLRYALPSPPFLVKQLSNSHSHLIEIRFHAILASIALLIGPFQILTGLRKKIRRVHRLLGCFYVASLVGAWGFSLVLAPRAAGGLASEVGFYLSGTLWVGFTGFALAAIRKRDVPRHQRWMLRSYAMAWAVVTIRPYMMIGSWIGLQFSTSLALSDWLCWITNLVFVELYIAMGRRQSSETLASYRDVAKG